MKNGDFNAVVYGRKRCTYKRTKTDLARIEFRLQDSCKDTIQVCASDTIEGKDGLHYMETSIIEVDDNGKTIFRGSFDQLCAKLRSQSKIDKYEIVDHKGDYAIVKLYANQDDSIGGYGDIYDLLEDCQKEHPNEKVLYGYGILDINTGFLVDQSKDWYDCLGDAQDVMSILQ